MVLATVATDLHQLGQCARGRCHRMGCRGDWDCADCVRRDLGPPAHAGLSPHAPGQPWSAKL